jgi:hypothetical protein
MAQVKNASATEWELGGIFTTKEKAIAACVDEWDGIWEQELDVPSPLETIELGYYPLEQPSDE